MPTTTFKNLSEDKKKRIFNAAVGEFSNKRFNDASINQIIKRAEIPKGSFYQYFEGKEDLYMYMMGKIEEEKRQITHSISLDQDADVFEIGMQKMKAAYEWGKLKPDYGRIGVLMWRDNSEFVAKFRTTTIDWTKKYIERDKERGLIKPEANSNLVADMLITLLLNEGFFAGLNDKEYFEKLDGVMKILKKGVSLTK
nr:TetR/AcrR family transcriptional regulator [uncultured Aminipila sp.]